MFSYIINIFFFFEYNVYLWLVNVSLIKVVVLFIMRVVLFRILSLIKLFVLRD